ncbi:SDR family oxidoreductase [Muricoccus pecuniae]|uniref:Uncharacterized protein YbjT (DUF2867 family) n=1 Tax=Muricoccus pecuniae TaxID=693023 RepID=A0A840YMZ9_9PROT|nr:SDR family oxidoreductase [Roseomonas pecuniae]MBB5696194.1 uncharacterized protein YbjT (DUF2867 family) [Roseomonas pecuniae]
MSATHLKILSVGATGSIGRHVVEEALAMGHGVRALVRNPGKVPFPPGVEVLAGDLTRPASLVPALDGIGAIVFTHGTYGGAQAGAEAVDYGGVRNVLAALRGRQVRVALMTTIGVTDRKGVHDWKRRGERLLRASGLPYTIVRPGWFDYNDRGQERLVLLQGDRRQTGTPRDGVVARRQIACVLVRSLSSTYALRKTFELVAERGPEPADMDELFAMAVPDDDPALDGIQDARNMPLDNEPPEVVKELEIIHASNRGPATTG